ncbi:Ras-like protein rasC [Acropora cervicornis]|uniref:Ras-like protein rasC n=1 Tax=Acropora cervicornis TaxID=6130 RepID=A0AAD9QYG9_ACRCE|nr:Ras-like protein rasC [Acropora cervicornis]
MFRLCVVGSGGVGKSSLTIRYLKNEFTEIEYNGRLYEVEIVDTAGQEEYSSFRDSSVATGDAFLVLFAINSVSSWHELKDLRKEEREVNKDEVLEYCNSADVNIPLIETSAKTGLNVEESFQLMMQQIQRIQPSLFERAAPKSQGNKAPKKPDCLLV